VPKQYVLKLTVKEREELQHVVRRGRVAGWKVQRVQALLQCDQGPDGPAWTDEQIVATYGITPRSLESWRKQAVERGPLSLLERKPRVTPSAVKAGGHGLILRFGGATLILACVAVVMSFFVTVTHEDAVYYLDRKSAIRLSNPRPGALYAVDGQQIFGDYLCEFEAENGDIIGAEASPRYYEFYNQAGELLPALAALNRILVDNDKSLQHQGENRTSYRKWQVRELTFINSLRPIKKSCELNVIRALDQGKRVCGINAVMIRHDDEAPYAVKFNNSCLIKCAENGAPCHPEGFPHLNDAAWTTRLKHQLDLITGGPASPVGGLQTTSRGMTS
jgi:hypothetical protein